VLKIRQEQSDVFRRESLDRFEANAVRHLRTHLADPTQDYTDEELRQRVRNCISRSTSHGLRSEQQVMCFVDTSFLLNEQFDTDPAHAWAAKVLRSEKLEPGQKATVLLATATNVYNGRA
jgi:hypothetical protein